MKSREGGRVPAKTKKYLEALGAVQAEKTPLLLVLESRTPVPGGLQGSRFQYPPKNVKTLSQRWKNPFINKL